MTNLTWAVRMQGVNKRFGLVQANDNVDLQVADASIHAVVGENGAGKSTLMSILYGMYQADAGRIEFSDLHVAWHGPDRTLTFTRDALQQMRAQGLVSFGSCSFTEPVDESRALGWL